MADAEANDDLVRRFIAAWERRDTDFIVDCFADDGIYHATPLDPIAGKEAIRDGEQRGPGLEEMRATAIVLEAIERSAAGGGWEPTR